MKGVIIGTGSWTALAKETAARASLMTGLDFQVLETPWQKVSHPSWLKLWVADKVRSSDGWCVLDADMIMLKPWNPVELLYHQTPPTCLMMTRDRPHPAVDAECQEHGLRADRYLNGGLMLYTEAGAELLRQAQKDHPKCGRWMEQTAVNKVCRDNMDKVRILPRAYNLVSEAADILKDPSTFRHAVNVHVVGLRGDLATFRKCRARLTSP